MAYEVKELADKLKSKGLDIAEEAVVQVIEASLEWAQESASKGSVPVVDGLVLALGPQVASALKHLADKIDGKDDVK